jgi:hypothetical protein
MVSSVARELPALGGEWLVHLPLERVVAEYRRYFNAERPHQGLAQQIPTGAARPANINGRVVETPVLGGLHHAYRRAA